MTEALASAYRERLDMQTPGGQMLRQQVEAMSADEYNAAYQRAAAARTGQVPENEIVIHITPRTLAEAEDSSSGPADEGTAPIGGAERSPWDVDVSRLPGVVASGVGQSVTEFRKAAFEIAQLGVENFELPHFAVLMGMTGDWDSDFNLTKPTGDLPEWAQGMLPEDLNAAESMVKGIAQFVGPFSAVSKAMKAHGVFAAVDGASKWVNAGRAMIGGAVASLPVDALFFDHAEVNMVDIAKEFGYERELLNYWASKDDDGTALTALRNRVNAALTAMPLGVAFEGLLRGGSAAMKDTVVHDVVTNLAPKAKEFAANAYIATAKSLRALREYEWAELEETALRSMAKTPRQKQRGSAGVPPLPPSDTENAWKAVKVIAARMRRHGDAAEFSDVMKGVAPEDREAVLSAAEKAAAAGKLGTVKGFSVEELRESIPPEKRVSTPKTMLKPGPVRTAKGGVFKDLDLEEEGDGVLGMTQDDLTAVWRKSVDDSKNLQAGELVVDLGAEPRDIEFWESALRLPNQARYWYEVSTEAMHEVLSDFTPAELETFFSLVAATSPQANPYDNMRRALSVMGHILADRPVTTALSTSMGGKGDGVRSAIFGIDSKTNKVHNFNGTFEYLAGMRLDPPLSTNDRQVAKTFGITPEELFGNQAVYEPISLFYINLRDALNERLPKGVQPYESWQLQALGWVEERIRDVKGSNTSDDYMQSLERITNEIADALPDFEYGQPLTKAVLMREDVQRVIDSTTEKFEASHIATVEAMSENSPQTARLLGMREHWDDKTVEAVNASIRRTMKNLSTQTKTPVLDKDGKPVLDEKGKPKTTQAPSVASNALSAARSIRAFRGVPGASERITRIDYGRGTWQGNVNANMRIPLMDATKEEKEIFLAFYTEGLDQDLAPASVFKKTRHDAPVPEGNTRTYSTFFPMDMDDAAVKTVSDALGGDFEVSVKDLPNGTQFDIAPSFGPDGAPVGITFEDVEAALEQLPPEMTGIVSARDFESVPVFRDGNPVTDLDGNPVKDATGEEKTRSATDILNQALRDIDTEAVDQLQQVATNASRKQLRAYLKTGDPSGLGLKPKPDGTLPKGRVGRMAKIRARRRGLHDNFTATRKTFAKELKRQEVEFGEITDRLEDKAGVSRERVAKMVAPQM